MIYFLRMVIFHGYVKIPYRRVAQIYGILYLIL